MNNSTNQLSELFNENNSANSLSQYVQSLDSDVAGLLSQPSPGAIKLMQQNLTQMLGGLPEPDFEVTITTNREALGQLLAAAMVNGYFLRRAEERMGWEKQLAASAEE